MVKGIVLEQDNQVVIRSNRKLTQRWKWTVTKIQRIFISKLSATRLDRAIYGYTYGSQEMKRRLPYQKQRLASVQVLNYFLL